MTTTEKFRAFVVFCFEHGKELKHHKEFGEMIRELDTEIETLEVLAELKP